MARVRYIVTYDISDDKRRTRTHTILRDYGDRLQYSVFRCDLDARELVLLRAALHGAINYGQDQVLIIALGPARGRAAQRVEALGRPYAPEPRIRVV